MRKQTKPVCHPAASQGPGRIVFPGEDIRRKVNQGNLIGNRDSVTQRRDIVLCPYTLFTVGFYEL